MTTVLKLGGSLITEKHRRETVDEATLTRAAESVARASTEDLVLIHGGGSFGHPHASDHRITTTEGSHDAGAARSIHAAMEQLNHHVLDALAAEGVAALPVQPLSFAHRDESGDLALPAEGIATILEEGFVPVLHGDVIAHAGAGVTILSGDELAVALADRLGAKRVGLCSAVPGVLDTEGGVLGMIESFSDAADALGPSGATDVTGGMAAKVRALLALDAPAWVFGIDGLEGFLAGESSGTRIG